MVAFDLTGFRHVILLLYPAGTGIVHATKIRTSDLSCSFETPHGRDIAQEICCGGVLSKDRTTYGLSGWRQCMCV